MKRLLQIFLPLLLLLPAPCLAQPLRLTVSVEPVAWLVRNVAGQRAKVDTLLPAGACPETFRPGPKALRAAAASDLVLFVGGGFEDPWLALLLEARPDLRLAMLGLGLAEDGDRNLFGIWLDPARAKILARHAAQALELLDQDGTEEYRGNLQELEARLDRLDGRVAALFQDLDERRLFFCGRPDWIWLARAQGLVQKAVAGPLDMPSPSEQKEALLQARRCRAQYILDRPRCGSKAARALALRLKAEILPVDPLARDYEDNLLAAARRIRAALCLRLP